MRGKPKTDDWTILAGVSGILRIVVMVNDVTEGVVGWDGGNEVDWRWVGGGWEVIGRWAEGMEEK